ncbi:SIMPL domain-containing protein [bacterium]|nr:SIMPL domain-containing protein [bacterium]
MLQYNANQQFEVRSGDVDLVVEVASAVEELMREGISLTSQAPDFLYTKLDEARISLMADATRDAKARAEQISEAAGGKIGPIRDARMGVIQVVAPNSTNISDYGMYDTSTREKDVVGVVKVNFAVE